MRCWGQRTRNLRFATANVAIAGVVGWSSSSRVYRGGGSTSQILSFLVWRKFLFSLIFSFLLNFARLYEKERKNRRSWEPWIWHRVQFATSSRPVYISRSFWLRPETQLKFDYTCVESERVDKSEQLRRPHAKKEALIGATYPHCSGSIAFVTATFAGSICKMLTHISPSV